MIHISSLLPFPCSSQVGCKWHLHTVCRNYCEAGCAGRPSTPLRSANPPSLVLVFLRRCGSGYDGLDGVFAGRLAMVIMDDVSGQYARECWQGVAVDCGRHALVRDSRQRAVVLVGWTRTRWGSGGSYFYSSLFIQVHHR